MVRKPVVIFTSLVLLAAANAKALGLGDITLESALNQPLRANIPLLQLGDVRAEQISVQLASETDFARFSIDREAFLGSIRFEVLSAGADALVQLSTLDSVREPYLSFVLETRWPTGRLLSEYTVLLDLPAFADNAPAPSIQQAVQQVTQTTQPPVQTIENQLVEDASSSGLARDSQRFAAPAEPAPGTIADTPEPAEELVVQSDLDATADSSAPIDALAAPAPDVPEPAAAPAPQAAPGEQETVTTGANDTLWDIALEVRPDSSVSVQQTMLAIQRMNTDAFIGDNINMVRRGQVLRIPDIDQIRALSAREAIGEVARQNQLFENRRNVPLTSQPVTALPAAPADASGGPRGELSVVSVDAAEPGAQSASGQNAELDARIASLEDVLAVQREEADRAALQNAELTERLGLLEEQIASAQEIIRLRDLELAQLQDSLANASAVEEAVEPPTVITMAPERSFLQSLLDTLIANTLALLGVTALVISLLVFMLLKRNRAAEQAALAGMDGIAVEPRITESDIDDKPQQISNTDNTVTGQDASTLATETADFEEIFDLAAAADDDLRDALKSEVPETAESADVLMAEVEALISEARFEEAAGLLQDNIVAQPERTDLRMKLLEVFAAAQDPIGFKLQETELRDLAGDSFILQIAVLRARLRAEVQDEILDEGDDMLFEETDPLDDLELSLDMEASAEVDDSKVLAGMTLEDSALVTELPIEAVPAAAKDVDEFALDDIDFDFEEQDDETPVARSSAAHMLESKFDLAAEDKEPVAESDIASAVETGTELTAAETGDDDDNLLDFEFAVLDDDEEDFEFDAAAFDLALEEGAADKAQSTSTEDLEDLQFVDDTLLDSLEQTAVQSNDDDEDDFVYLSDADEAATKLDLARAYFEMGDSDGAREILEEVLKEGNGDQIKDAQDLLSKL